MELSGVCPSENSARVDACHDRGLIDRHHVDPFVAVVAPLETSAVAADNHQSVHFKCDFRACFHESSCFLISRFFRANSDRSDDAHPKFPCSGSNLLRLDEGWRENKRE